MKIFIKPSHITIAVHTLIWAIVLLFPFLLSTRANDYSVGPIPGIFFSVCGLIHIAIFYVHAGLLYPRFFNRRYWWLYILLVAVLLFVSFQLKYYIMANWFTAVLKDVTTYKFIFGPSIAVYIVSLIYSRTLDRIQQEKAQKERQAAQLATELKFLRSQISPHFIFNVLTNLVSLARKKSDQLETSLIMLADLMRYMLYDSHGSKVTVEKEVAYLNSYIALQQLRFGNDVAILNKIELDHTAATVTIEPMLLIPFVENAFKHGTGWIEHPQIDIHLSVKQALLHFEVWNQYDREQDTSKDESSGIGLANVRTRLDLLYKDQYTLQLQDDNNLFHITLTLKLS